MRRLAYLPLAVIACTPPTVDDPFTSLSIGTASTMTTAPPEESGTTDQTGSGSESSSATDSASTTATTTNATTMPADTGSSEASSGDTPAVCGDEMVGGDEVCDGTDFGEESCVSQGFSGGELECNATCNGFSTNGCFICGNGMLEGTEDCEGSVPAGTGCEDVGFTEGSLTCDMTTCLFDTSACTLCGDGLVQGAEACDSGDVGGQTCADIGFTDGDLACNDADCTLDFGGCTGTNLTCAEQVVGNTYPQSIVGTTAGEDEDIAQSCGAAGVDYLVVFIAPVAGAYTFDMIGSSYDTVLSVHSDCMGTELGCNDDFAGNPTCGCCSCSEVDLNLNAGDQIILAVSGYSGGTGAFTLNIDGP